MTKPYRNSLGSTVLAVLGTSVQAFADVAKDPKASAALGAAAGAWIGPVGVVFGALAGIGTNRVASALDRRADALRVARELLHNEDIARVQAAAIAARIARHRDTLPRLAIGKRGQLAELSQAAPAWWERVRVAGLAGVADTELVDTLANVLVAGTATLPGPAAWKLILHEASLVSGKPLDAELIEPLATELAERFAHDVFEALKSDSRAFASAVLRFLAEILIELRTRPDGVNSGALDAAVAKLEEAASALGVLKQIPAELRNLANEVAGLKQVVTERLVPRPANIPIQLPPAAQRFFGRRDERAKLVAFLRDSQPLVFVVGTAGMGKTALAADAIAELVGTNGERLAGSAFTDGIVFLDGYTLKQPDAVWAQLAAIFEPALLREMPRPRDAAQRACLGKRLLVVLEGAEVFDDPQGVLDVLEPRAKRLVLTRRHDQVVRGRDVDLRYELSEPESLDLLRGLASGAPEALLVRVNARLRGHPLALTWAGSQLALDEQNPGVFVRELEIANLPDLHAPGKETHTLPWLFGRSLRGLDDDSRAVLVAFGVLALAPVPIAAAQAALECDDKRARAAVLRLVRHSWLRLASESPETWQVAHALAYQFARQLSDACAIERTRSFTHERLRVAIDAARSESDADVVRAALPHACSAAPKGTRLHEFDPLLKFLLYDAQLLLTNLGTLDGARACIEAAANTLECIVPTSRGPAWTRERSVALSMLGNIQLDQGDLANARLSFERDLEIARALVATDPSNPDWQRDLSVSLNSLGGVQLAQGDLANARASFEADLEIARGLLAADPTNAAKQRDLSVSLTKLGDVQLAQGNLEDARASYDAGRQVVTNLIAASPGIAEWQRDLSVYLNKLGDVQLAQGDLANARVSYDTSQAIRRKLVAADPTNVAWRRDLSVSLSKLGDVQLRERDIASARASYDAAKETAEKLVAADPTNAAWQRDLGVSLEKLGDVQLAQGDFSNARASYAESQAIRQRLVAADPTNTAWQRDLVVSHVKVGDIARHGSDAPAARKHYEQALAIAARLSRLDPTNAQWRKDVEGLRMLLDSL